MSKSYVHIKKLMFSQPEVLHGLLQKLADAVVTYIKYQVSLSLEKKGQIIEKKSMLLGDSGVCVAWWGMGCER